MTSDRPGDPPPPERPEEPGTVKPLPSAAAFLAMGSTAAICVAIGVVAGLYADRALHTAPALLLVGLALGLVLAVVSVVAQIRRYL